MPVLIGSETVRGAQDSTSAPPHRMLMVRRPERMESEGDHALQAGMCERLCGCRWYVKSDTQAIELHEEEGRPGVVFGGISEEAPLGPPPASRRPPAQVYMAREEGMAVLLLLFLHDVGLLRHVNAWRGG